MTKSKLDRTAPRVIEIVKREVVGQVTLDENGSVDVLDQLATVAMQNARDDMRSDAHSKSVYEVELPDGSITSVAIEHTPSDIANPPMSVDELQRLLREARQRERDDSDDEVVTAVEGSDWK